MATETKNYHFIKPELTDDADIRVINTNFDRLDDMVFQSGELGNHTGSQTAHDFLFAKYMPLAGGTFTGRVNFAYTVHNGNTRYECDYLNLDDARTITLGNGYGKQYGAKIQFYGNDITTGYTGRKNEMWLSSTDSTDTTKNTTLKVTSYGVQISTNNVTTALNTPNVRTARIISTTDGVNFLESANGNCSMNFSDRTSNKAIIIKVEDNEVRIDKDGVFYNGIPSLYVEEYSEKTIDDYTVRVTRYNTGLMIIEYCLTGEHTLTFPIPFKDDTYVCTSDYTNKTAEGITISRDTILRGRWK